MNKVEFFGISGSGKTTFKDNIKNTLKEKKVQCGQPLLVTPPTAS